MLDYIRIACAVPRVHVGDVAKNAEDICVYMAKADDQNADVILFPELSLTGYTCGDLFFQDVLLQSVKQGLARIAECSAKYPKLLTVVGLPLDLGSRMYNCAAVVAAGKVAALIPKTYLPAGEGRWFSGGEELRSITLDVAYLGLPGEYQIPVEKQLVFSWGDGSKIGIEICQDLWAPLPPSSMLAMNGAEVILNLSASHELVGKRETRRNLVKHQSMALHCVYAYCSAADTESTQDMVFSGHSMIAENGTILQENSLQLDGDYMLLQDCDLGKIRAERRRNKTFHDTGSTHENWTRVREIALSMDKLRGDGSLYPLEQLPFVPRRKEMLAERCQEIFNIQVHGLKRRLEVLSSKAVVGVSGGLDSTLALLVAVEAIKRLGRPATDVHGITMPCFGTSGRTNSNAKMLMNQLGVTQMEIPISEAVALHFRDIGQDPSTHDTVYENAQARERTQILMDYAGKIGGIVVGSGDLSELALGWCTYNGDHMSMYSVNASVPKTVIPRMLEMLAQTQSYDSAGQVLLDIVATPISPELLPPGAGGEISQQTEDLVGPYELHDFFLYYLIRFGFSPRKLYAMACRAFAGKYETAVLRKWLIVFIRRFFAQQYKRNCQPDGVKVGSVSLSPRGDWSMPSDAVVRMWLEQLNDL